MLSSHIKTFKTALKSEFSQKKKILPVTKKLVNFTDEILTTIFQNLYLHKENSFALLAVGSYGRRELQLHSDIDLLLLHSDKFSEENSDKAQQFIQQCWDAGLNISHQITNVNELADLAEKDLSVISSIMDMRLVAGQSSLMEELAYHTHPLHMWPSDQFFRGKKKEQALRYAKYGETAYNLEPNVKYGPGGLRDLQVLLSIGKRHFGIQKLSDGIACGFFSDKEYDDLIHCLHFLWKIRFALHSIADKQEERLLFDHQIKLADFFSYTDKNHNLAIELFMKDYFQVIKRSRELNDLLLQWFSEAIVEKPRVRIKHLNTHFQLVNNYLEVKHSQVFQQNPITILKLFNWLSIRPDIKGVRADTIRLLRNNLYLINKNFRHQTSATKLFLNLFRHKTPPYEILHRMNRYGVLGRYLKCFSKVTGQMQYDLFHVYTVDQHTLFVIRNLCRFLDPAYKEQFPLAHKLMLTLIHKDVVYFAALFHDIAKGRGGDHSELGAQEAEIFADHHQLSLEKKNLLIWLVKNHLLMSQTAQRFDIYDPQVINDFCKKLPQPYYLEYLYLLTVADICGTNPGLWTTWKDSLLKELYRAASQAMQASQLPINETNLILIKQHEAMQVLNAQGIHKKEVETLWKAFKGKYFLHESPEIIARHTKAILSSNTYPVIMILPHHTEGGTEVFIYMPHRDERFAIATTVLSNHRTTIQEASVLTCKNGYDLDTYIILDEQNKAFFSTQMIQALEKDLYYYLHNKNTFPPVIKRRISRTKAHFNIKCTIKFSYDPHLNLNQVFIVANDRPGLLSHISQVFVEQKILLHHAKIATAGERVEDTFIISDKYGKPLSEDVQKELRTALYNKAC